MVIGQAVTKRVAETRMRTAIPHVNDGPSTMAVENPAAKEGHGSAWAEHGDGCVQERFLIKVKNR